MRLILEILRSTWVVFNILKPKQNGQHFADVISNVFPCIKIFVFQSKFQFSFFLSVQFTMNWPWFANHLVLKPLPKAMPYNHGYEAVPEPMMNQWSSLQNKCRTGPQTLTGKIWVGPASSPSLSYINFGKLCFGPSSFRSYFEDWWSLMHISGLILGLCPANERKCYLTL